jgi:hypothetical protein
MLESMSGMKRPCLAGWVVAFTLLGLKAAHGQQLEFCLLPVQPALLQAHASFNAIYGFDVDKLGVPTNVEAIIQAFSDPDEIRACMQKWKLPGEVGKHLTAAFEWQHAIGWTMISISGPGVSLSIRLSGERCPYCRAQEQKELQTPESSREEK